MNPEVAIYLIGRGADVNAFTSGGVTVAWGVQSRIARQERGSEMQVRFERVREAMIVKGAKFPADPPAKVREWMKSRGMKVAE